MAKNINAETGVSEVQFGGLFFSLAKGNTSQPDALADFVAGKLFDRGVHYYLAPVATDEQARKRDKPIPDHSSH